jgi:hypothetical protein
MPYGFAPALPTKWAYSTSLYPITSRWSSIKDIVNELESAQKSKKVWLRGQLCLTARSRNDFICTGDIGQHRQFYEGILYIIFNNPMELRGILEQLKYPEESIRGIALWNHGRFGKHAT